MSNSLIKKIAKNPGHENLISDLKQLLSEAEDYQFDDFKNTKYAGPKSALVDKLTQLRMNAMNGKYDQ